MVIIEACQEIVEKQIGTIVGEAFNFQDDFSFSFAASQNENCHLIFPAETINLYVQFVASKYEYSNHLGSNKPAGRARLEERLLHVCFPLCTSLKNCSLALSGEHYRESNLQQAVIRTEVRQRNVNLLCVP